MGSRVHLDFRDFVNTLRRTKKGIYASTQDPEIRLAIYRDVADSKTFLEPKGPDTGATKASLEAVRHGGNGVNGKAYTSQRTGKTHYAYSSIGPEGITILPMTLPSYRLSMTMIPRHTRLNSRLRLMTLQLKSLLTLRNFLVVPQRETSSTSYVRQS